MNTAQPKILRLLAFVQMCKFFSHYGVRALLVLYMVGSLQFTDSRAFGVNAVFCGLIELGGIFGGILADRYLGLRRAMMLGGWFLGIGYLGLLLQDGFFFSLGMIILGGSLFASNISAILGQAYDEDDERRESGFTIFYMMQNLGALISTLLCGVIATHFGFRLGFAVAASGMLVGCIALLLKRNEFQPSHISITKSQLFMLLCIAMLIFGIGVLAVNSENLILPILPWITVAVFVLFAIKLLKDPSLPNEEVRRLLLYLAGLIFFFAAEDQICSSLIIFAERETDREVFGWMVPSSIIMSVNPIVIILFGTMIARLRSPIITPFVLVFIAFGSLALLCLMHLGLSIFGVIGMVAVISLAELMVGPLVSSIASEVAAKGNPGMVMGMVPISFSLAFLLGGSFSNMVAIDQTSVSLAIYGEGFGKIALLTLVVGLLLQILMKRFYAKRPVY